MAIIDHDVLVFQQTKNLVKNDFAIFEPGGQQVAHVETGGSTLSRLMVGSRQLTVFDGPENPILQVKDSMTLGRDRMEILDGRGTPIASILKRITMFKTRVSVDYRGEELELSGNLWGFDFEVTGPRGVLATASREWSGMGNAFLGKSTYAVNFAPQLDTGYRLAVIGAVLALDLIREKRNRG